MKIAIITSFNEPYAEIADVSLPLMTRYANMHGYGLHVGKYHEDPSQLKTYGDRGKIDLFLQHYDDHDILMWLDIDVLIMNSAIRIEERLGERPFLWTYDPNGPCSGFWIARCCTPTKLFLTTVAERAQFAGHLRAAESLGPPHSVTIQLEPRGTSDQMMMRELMNIPPYSRVARYCVSSKEAGHCYDYREMLWPTDYDEYGHYEPGDWLLTFPSIPPHRRLELMKQRALEAM